MRKEVTLKKRQLKKTILIVGEGETEDAVATHFKNLFWDRINSKFSIKVKYASGGSPLCVIQHAEKITSAVNYDRVYIILDNDKEICLRSKKLIEKNKFHIIYTPDCMDCALIRMLGENPIHSKCKSKIKSLIGDLPTHITIVEKVFLESIILKGKHLSPFKELYSIMIFGEIILDN